MAETRYFAGMAMAGYLNREVGHAGQGFNYLRTAPGANAGGPAATAAFFNDDKHFAGTGLLVVGAGDSK